MLSWNTIKISTFSNLKNRNTYGLEKYFMQIEDWLVKSPTEDGNVPLVIEADDGVGKKTLIVNWIEYHSKNSRKVYISINS